MASKDEWAAHYAQQAEADFIAWQAICASDKVKECHKLLFLQMACEKICKSHLAKTGTPPNVLQSSHAYIAKTLPQVIRQDIVQLGGDLKHFRSLMKSIRHLSREIELLSPSVDDNGKRPENCEYPWEDHAGKMYSPLKWTFPPSHLLLEPNGVTFLKRLRVAIHQRTSGP